MSEAGDTGARIWLKALTWVVGITLTVLSGVIFLGITQVWSVSSRGDGVHGRIDQIHAEISAVHSALGNLKVEVLENRNALASVRSGQIEAEKSLNDLIERVTSVHERLENAVSTELFYAVDVDPAEEDEGVPWPVLDAFGTPKTLILGPQFPEARGPMRPFDANQAPDWPAPQPSRE